MTRRDLIRTLSGGIAGIPAVNSVERVDAKAGDVIVLKYAGYMPIEAARRLKEQVQEIFPNQKVMVLTDGLDVEVIRTGND